MTATIETLATMITSHLWDETPSWVDEISLQGAAALISAAISDVIDRAGSLLARADSDDNKVVFECAAESLMSMATVQYGVAMGGLSHNPADWKLDLLNIEPATQWRRDIFWAVAVELRYLNRMAQLYAQ